MKTIKSWIDKKVRIKRKYILTTEEDGQIYHSIDAPNGLNSMVDSPIEGIFMVKSDVYGVDLYKYRHKEFEIGSIEPTHQIIIEQVDNTTNNIGYPFLWDSKYFEIIN